MTVVLASYTHSPAACATQRRLAGTLLAVRWPRRQPSRSAAPAHSFLRLLSKKKAVHKTTTTDDKRLQNTLKRLSVNTIPGIEEVSDGSAHASRRFC